MIKINLFLLLFLPIALFGMNKNKRHSLRIVELSVEFKDDTKQPLHPISPQTSGDSVLSFASIGSFSEDTQTNPQNSVAIAANSTQSSCLDGLIYIPLPWPYCTIRRLIENEIERELFDNLERPLENIYYALDWEGERYSFVNDSEQGTINYSSDKKVLKSISGFYIRFKKTFVKDPHQDEWEWGLRFKVSDCQTLQLIKKRYQHCIFLEIDTDPTNPIIKKPKICFNSDKQFLILTQEYPSSVQEKIKKCWSMFSQTENNDSQIGPKIYRVNLRDQ